MPYLIDGHNLIPKVPGLSLRAADDEMQLVALLQEFCRRQRKQVEVFFDNAPPGGARARVFGPVTARFVRAGQTADQAIYARLQRLGRAARNWTVVSSDRAVQAAARGARSQALSSEEFATFMMESLDDQQVDDGATAEAAVSADEVDEWLQLFGADEKDT